MPVLHDLTGQKYGRLTVVSRGIGKAKNETYWDCVCDCGSEYTVMGRSLKQGRTISCGCARKEKSIGDLSGKKFGYLTAIKFNGKNKYGKDQYECICDCGNIHIVVNASLTSGNTTNCGCIRRSKTTKHGMAKTRLWNIWKAMKQRCRGSSKKSKLYYKDKNVQVYSEWLHPDTGFQAFYNWSMANGYREDLTIDRYPNYEGNYEPSNCRWATMTEQNRNQSLKSNNTSGFAGVSFHKQNKKWVATIRHKGKKLYLGIFDTVEDATQARKKAEEKYWNT